MAAAHACGGRDADGRPRIHAEDEMRLKPDISCGGLFPSDKSEGFHPKAEGPIRSGAQLATRTNRRSLGSATLRSGKHGSG